jgi:hypothetical protein
MKLIDAVVWNFLLSHFKSGGGMTFLTLPVPTLSFLLMNKKTLWASLGYDIDVIMVDEPWNTSYYMVKVYVAPQAFVGLVP